jgi:uncharacterized membrane protein YbaN (DUF454 family)
MFKRKLPVSRLLFVVPGGLFLAIGLVLLFLPPLPGLLFVAIGLLLLAQGSSWVSCQVDKLGRRYPSFGKHLRRARKRIRVCGWS